MALFSAGSSITYHLASSVLNAITTCHPFILPVVVFPKALFSALLAFIHSFIHSFIPFQLLGLEERLRNDLFFSLYASSGTYKNSSGDEIANVNFLRRYRRYVLQNTKKENLLRLTS